MVLAGAAGPLNTDGYGSGKRDGSGRVPGVVVVPETRLENEDCGFSLRPDEDFLTVLLWLEVD